MRAAAGERQNVIERYLSRGKDRVTQVAAGLVAGDHFRPLDPFDFWSCPKAGVADVHPIERFLRIGLVV